MEIGLLNNNTLINNRERIWLALQKIRKHTFNEKDLEVYWEEILTHKLFVAAEFLSEGKLGTVAFVHARQYPSKRVLVIVGIEGNLKKFAEWKRFMIELAKDSECKAIEVIGRKGWIKVAKKLGLEPKYYTFIMELGD